jgi:hypothetical protein
MFGITFMTAPGRLERLPGEGASADVTTGSRRIALLRSGRRHGPLTRLITPWDIGELTQPFVFLGYSEHTPGEQTLVGAQPGIATLTLVLSGAFQLWVELSPSPASSTGESQCVTPHELQEEGPVRVVLGKLGRARSPLAHAPADINYFHVRLKDGQCWRYVAPDGHNVTWIAVDRGGVRLPEDGRVVREQIALFGDSRGVIEVQADGESSFVLGSARRVSNALVQGGRHPIETIRAAFVPRGNEPSVLDRRLARGKRR